MGFGRDIARTLDKWTTAFEEPVAVYCTQDDAQRIERIGSVRATVIIGSGMSGGAGAQMHTETADRYSVVIRCREWWSAFNFEPRLGMQFDIGTPVHPTRLIVKGVTQGEADFTCRCTRNMRVGAA